MREGRIVALRIAKRLEGRHAEEVLRDDITRGITAVSDIGPSGRKETLCPLDALHRFDSGRRPRVEVLGQTVNLSTLKIA